VWVGLHRQVLGIRGKNLDSALSHAAELSPDHPVDRSAGNRPGNQAKGKPGLKSLFTGLAFSTQQSVRVMLFRSPPFVSLAAAATAAGQVD
jgi:hypothetical protein